MLVYVPERKERKKKRKNWVPLGACWLTSLVFLIGEITSYKKRKNKNELIFGKILIVITQK
jgi:hypothetical protein